MQSAFDVGRVPLIVCFIEQKLRIAILEDLQGAGCDGSRRKSKEGLVYRIIGLLILFEATSCARENTVNDSNKGRGLGLEWSLNDGATFEAEAKMTMISTIAPSKLSIIAREHGAKFIESLIVNSLWKVINVSSKAKGEVFMKCTRVQYAATSDITKAVTYDSREGGSIGGQLGRTLTPLLNALSQLECTITMSNLGIDMDDVLPGPVLQAILRHTQNSEGLQAVVNGEAIKYLMFGCLPRFPKRGLDIGSEWECDRKLMQSGNLTHCKQRFRCEKVVAENGYSGVIIGLKEDLKSTETDDGGVGIKYLPRLGTGELRFDLLHGWISEMNQRQEWDTEVIFVNGPPGKVAETTSISCVFTPTGEAQSRQN